jgi:hypothetical protein
MRYLSVVFLFGLLFQAPAWAAVTYDIVAPPYGVDSPPWTADMNVSFSFTVNEPLPPDSIIYLDPLPAPVPPGLVILPAISFLLDDGLNQYRRSNTEIPTGSFVAVTDNAGRIITLQISVFSPGLNVGVGDTLDQVQFVYSDDGTGSIGAFLVLNVTGLVCTAVSDPGCVALEQGPDFAQLIFSGEGAIVSSFIRPIPTLSTWALLLLILAMGAVGHWMRPRGS